ncbi:alpha/beta hydrolase [Enterococcus sp. LJL51]|uniref:alpha/beta hydrolase n=1 Tax=Enterococcus sp. LJL51 TaxID=3416656 RepID=UPI003CF4903C
MFYAKQEILEEGWTAELSLYIQDNFAGIDPKRKRPLILICPGGGYENLSDREGEPVALRMLALGFHAAVLKYSVAPAEYPTALRQLGKALLCIKDLAAVHGIDHQRIFVMGFSAGGHLAASLGAFWQDKLLSDLTNDSEQLRPAGLILCYPVISGGSHVHVSSFKKLLGDRLETLRDQLSIEQQVTAAFPPTFIWHTLEDQVVPVQNSLLLVEQLVKKKIFCEFHLYPKGPHGLSLGTEETKSPERDMILPRIQSWPEDMAKWLDEVK